MRNSVKVIDPSIPQVNIFNLAPGEMFQYQDTKDANAVYMKVEGFGRGDSAIYLVTGMYYNINVDAKLRRVSLIEISRPI